MVTPMAIAFMDGSGNGLAIADRDAAAALLAGDYFQLPIDEAREIRVLFQVPMTTAAECVLSLDQFLVPAPAATPAPGATANPPAPAARGKAASAPQPPETPPEMVGPKVWTAALLFEAVRAEYFSLYAEEARIGGFGKYGIWSPLDTLRLVSAEQMPNGLWTLTVQTDAALAA